MSIRRSLLQCSALLLLATIMGQFTLSAQDAASSASIAVVRLKGVDIAQDSQTPFTAVLPALNASLRANGRFDVPSDDILNEALDDEGIEQGELIDMDDLADLAETLGLDYFVIGSVSQKMLSFHTHLRIYSAKDKRLLGVVSSDQPIDPPGPLATYVADMVETAVRNPGSIDTLYENFAWTQQALLTFGSDRSDLLPPRVYFVNDNPPFEISVKVDMERMRSSFAVINISFYADGEPIGSIYPQLNAPRVLNEEMVEIGGHMFCFELDVRELRTTSSGGIMSAKVVFNCRHCHEDE